MPKATIDDVHGDRLRFLAFDSSLHANWPKRGSTANFFDYFSSRKPETPQGRLSIVPDEVISVKVCLQEGNWRAPIGLNLATIDATRFL